MGFLEIIIVACVVWWIVNYINRPNLGNSSGVHLPIIAAIVGAIVVLGIGATAVFYLRMSEVPEPVAADPVVDMSTLPAPVHVYDDLSGHHEVFPAEVIDVNASWPAVGLIGIVFAFLIFCLVAAIRGSRVAGYFLAGAGCLLAVGVLMIGAIRYASHETHSAIVMNNESTRLADSKSQHLSREGASKPSISVEDAVGSTAVDINVPTEIVEVTYLPNSISKGTSKTLPQWASEQTGTDTDRKLTTVVSSGRFATLEEAEEVAWGAANSLVLSRLTKKYPSMSDWQLNPRDLQGLVVKKGCEVTYPLAIGGFTEEVHQVHLKIELDPFSEEKLYAMWRPTELNKRLTYLGVGMGVVTSILGVGAFATRRKEE